MSVDSEGTDYNELVEGSKASAEERQTQESAQPAVPTAAPVAGGIDPVGQALIQHILAGGVLGKEGETKGPEVMLTRDIKGPTKYEGRESFESQPRYKPPLSNIGGRSQGRYTVKEDVTIRGSIDEERRDYDEYSKSGFLGNNNDRINDGVVTAAGGDPEKYESVFQAAVAQAAYIQKASAPGSIGSKTTVEDVLQGWIKNGLPDSLKGGGGGGGGGGSRAFTNVDTRVDLTNEGEARRILDNALAGALGRDPTAAENRAFRKALNMYEKENPTVTTSKGVASASGTTSTTESEGGFDSLDFADRYAKSQEGYAEYQTATTYLDAFINALEDDARVI
jgi:hypothetical protein